MKKTLLVVVILVLITGLCAAAASAVSDNGQEMGQALSLQQGGIQEFSDVEGHWAAWAINKAKARDIFEGYGDGTFGPENFITNAQVLVLLDRLTDDDSDADADDDSDADADDDSDADADDDSDADSDDDSDADADDDSDADADDDSDADADDDSDADDDGTDDDDDDGTKDDKDDDVNDDKEDSMGNAPSWAASSVRNALNKGYIKRFNSETQCQRAYALALIAQKIYDEKDLRDLPPGYLNPFSDLNEDSPFTGLEDEMDLTQAEFFKYMMMLHYDGIIKGSEGNLNPNGALKRAEMAVLINNAADYFNNDGK